MVLPGLPERAGDLRGRVSGLVKNTTPTLSPLADSRPVLGTTGYLPMRKGECPRGCREGVGWGRAEPGPRLLKTSLQAPGLIVRGKTPL